VPIFRNATPVVRPAIVQTHGFGGTMDRRTAHTKTDPKLNNTAPVALKNKFR